MKTEIEIAANPAEPQVISIPAAQAQMLFDARQWVQSAVRCQEAIAKTILAGLEIKGEITAVNVETHMIQVQVHP